MKKKCHCNYDKRIGKGEGAYIVIKLKLTLYFFRKRFLNHSSLYPWFYVELKTPFGDPVLANYM